MFMAHENDAERRLQQATDIVSNVLCGFENLLPVPIDALLLPETAPQVQRLREAPLKAGCLRKRQGFVGAKSHSGRGLLSLATFGPS